MTNKLHNTLIRQLKKTGLSEWANSNDERVTLFLEYVSNTYFDYDNQVERLDNTLEVSLEKSFNLIKKIEENAKNAENDFKLLVNGLPGLITWFDRELNYLGVNENFVNLTGKRREDFIGKKMGFLMGNTQSELISTFKEFVAKSDNHYFGDFEITMNEKTHYVYSHFQKIDNGNIIVIASIDLTERYKLQEIINHQNEMTIKNSKMAAIGEMAAGVAHEINNPLMVILGNTKILLSHLKNDEQLQVASTECKDKLEKINRMSNRINKIVRSLKYISRDGSNDPFVYSSFKEIFDTAIELCDDRLKINQINFSVMGDNEVLLYCQPISLSQVFLNLMNNAIDAIIGHESPWIRCEILKENKKTRILFKDSGIGISAEEQVKIFQPFYTTKEIGKGTGLGLSISKAIIESHGGKFYIDNECENTCFVIELSNEKKAM